MPFSVAVAAMLTKNGHYLTGDFTLASGRHSHEYLDVRSALLHKDVGPAIALFAVRMLGDELLGRVDALAGVLTGGALLAVRVTDIVEAPKHTLAIRAEAKDHGRPGCVLGRDNISGKHAVPEVILFEDVITSGVSALRALDALRDSAVRVSHLLAVVDRQEGGIQAVEQAYPGLRVYCLTTLAQVRESKIKP